MKFYVTFGQVHVHKVNGKIFDKDCVCVIDCKDEEEGNKIAFDTFDGVFHQHTRVKPPMMYYPRGLINLSDE